MPLHVSKYERRDNAPRNELGEVALEARRAAPDVPGVRVSAASRWCEARRPCLGWPAAPLTKPGQLCKINALRPFLLKLGRYIENTVRHSDYLCRWQ